MSYQTERAALIQRFIKDKWGWEETIEAILKWSSLEFNATWFDALAYYRLENHYPSLEDVPDPHVGMTVFIREESKRVQYVFEQGEWVKVQDVEDRIYG